MSQNLQVEFIWNFAPALMLYPVVASIVVRINLCSRVTKYEISPEKIPEK